MRFFLGVTPADLSENGRLKSVMAKLKRTVGDWGVPVRWTTPAIWHVTMIFFGDRSASEFDQIVRFLDRWVPPESGNLNLSLNGLGAFPSTDQGRVLWVGVRKNRDFFELQGNLEASLLSQGLLQKPDEDFQPHLTLARFRNPSHLGSLISLGNKTDFGDYPVKELILFESVLQGQIPKYIPRYVKSL